MRSASQTIGWWEARRAPFNLVVGIGGVASGALVSVVGLGNFLLFNGDFAVPDPPLLPVFFVIFYVFVANLCYTGGWVGELVVRAAWPEQTDRFATLRLSLGLLFSVLVTLLPGIVVGVAGVFGLLAHLFGVVHR